MKIVAFEVWECSRQEDLFDAARTGRVPMPWDVVVLRLTADSGLQGISTALGARSAKITATFLRDLVAPVVLGRDVPERPASRCPGTCACWPRPPTPGWRGSQPRSGPGRARSPRRSCATWWRRSCGGAT